MPSSSYNDDHGFSQEDEDEEPFVKIWKNILRLPGAPELVGNMVRLAKTALQRDPNYKRYRTDLVRMLDELDNLKPLVLAHTHKAQEATMDTVVKNKLSPMPTYDEKGNNVVPPSKESAELPSFVDDWIDQLIRFLAMKVLVKPVPSGYIRDAWQTLMTYPTMYSKLCRALGSASDIAFSCCSDHGPLKSRKGELYSLTVVSYELLFGEAAPTAFWPRNEPAAVEDGARQDASSLLRSAVPAGGRESTSMNRASKEDGSAAIGTAELAQSCATEGADDAGAASTDTTNAAALMFVVKTRQALAAKAPDDQDNGENKELALSQPQKAVQEIEFPPGNKSRTRESSADESAADTYFAPTCATEGANNVASATKADTTTAAALMFVVKARRARAVRAQDDRDNCIENKAELVSSSQQTPSHEDLPQGNATLKLVQVAEMVKVRRALVAHTSKEKEKDATVEKKGTRKSLRQSLRQRPHDVSNQAKRRLLLVADKVKVIKMMATKASKEDTESTRSSQPPRCSRDVLKQQGDAKRKLVIGSREMLHLQGERPCEGTLTDTEAGEHMAEIAYLLRTYLTTPQSEQCMTEKESCQRGDQFSVDAEQCHFFEAKEAVDSLTSLGLGENRREATAQGLLLLKGGFVIPASPGGQKIFRDGPDLYRFADRQELKETLDLNVSDDRQESDIEGSEKRMLQIALQATMDMPESLRGSRSDYVILKAVTASQGEDKQTKVQRAMHTIQAEVGIDQLTSCDLLRLMVWARDFKSGDYMQLSNRDLRQEERYHAESDKLIATLMAEYEERTRQKIQRWLKKASWERSVELRRNMEGHIVTSDPEDMHFAINVQLSVVKESLPQLCCIQAMIDVLLEFRTAQVRTREVLSESWREMGVEWLCAVINDSHTLVEYCEDLDIFGSAKKGVLPTIELKKVRDEVTKGYLDLSIEATDFLARSVMEDLRGPVLAQVLTRRWELEHDWGQICTATLKDYYEDLSEWLPKHIFFRLVKKCILLLQEEYVKGAFSQDESARRFLDAEDVSGHLLLDRKVLVDFFASMEDEMGRFGGKQQAENAFEILRAMASIVDAFSPKEVTDEINILSHELGHGYGQAAAMFLVRKTRRFNRRQLQRWECFLCASLEEADRSGTTDARVQCNLTPLVIPNNVTTGDFAYWDLFDDGDFMAEDNYADTAMRKVEYALDAASEAMDETREKLKHAAEDVVADLTNGNFAFASDDLDARNDRDEVECRRWDDLAIRNDREEVECRRWDDLASRSDRGSPAVTSDSEDSCALINFEHVLEVAGEAVDSAYHFTKHAGEEVMELAKSNFKHAEHRGDFTNTMNDRDDVDNTSESDSADKNDRDSLVDSNESGGSYAESVMKHFEHALGAAGEAMGMLKHTAEEVTKSSFDHFDSKDDRKGKRGVGNSNNCDKTTDNVEYACSSSWSTAANKSEYVESEGMIAAAD